MAVTAIAGPGKYSRSTLMEEGICHAEPTWNDYVWPWSTNHHPFLIGPNFEIGGHLIGKEYGDDDVLYAVHIHFDQKLYYDKRIMLFELYDDEDRTKLLNKTLVSFNSSTVVALNIEDGMSKCTYESFANFDLSPMRIFDILYVPRNNAGAVHMDEMCLANGLHDDVVAILSDDS